MIRVGKVTTDYVCNLIGVDHMPQFGWTIEGDGRNLIQEKYQLQISDIDTFEKVLYDSGMISNCDSQHIRPDYEIKSLSKYFARVRVQTTDNEQSEWSDTICFITGMCNEKWKAKFISADCDEDATNSKTTYVRKEFHTDKKIQEAFLVCSALGLYQVYLNGQRVGQDELTPGFTSYLKHTTYQTYEVTNFLQEGSNAISAMIGAGWYKGKMGFYETYNNYGRRSAFIGQLLIRYEDGTSHIIVTDRSWKGNDAPIVFAEIYDGETYDAHFEQKGWNLISYSEDGWRKVEVIPFDLSVLTTQPSARVNVMDQMPARRIFTTPRGDKVIDFGQNMSGWITVTAKGREGDVIQLNCFETLDSKGNVYLDNLRGAKEQIKYVFAESKTIEYHPTFTFQGFRYAQITSFPGTPKLKNFTAYTVHSNMGDTGTFECSNRNLNQLQHNILWSMKGNFVDIPTDCPQRNERLGWTGDAQIFCRTASYLMNTYQFYQKWLVDVSADQTPEGGISHVVPDIITGKEKNDPILSHGTHSASGWADVIIILPWVLYLTYGDTKILEKHFESMKKWIDFMDKHANNNIWNYGLQWGDWVALDAEEGSFFGATPNDLTCTAYYAYVTGLFARICNILGMKNEKRIYEDLYKDIVKTYQETFFNEDGTMTAKTQTAHIISLYFGLVPEKYKATVVNELKELLKKENGHLVTGFVGTPYFCHALSENGCTKEAYDLLLKDDFPSWLYQVKQGATTIWEHWDGLKPDGTMWSPDMNSFNHYAYGAVGEWLYRVCAGLNIDEQCPGYKHTILQPHVGGKLKWVSGTYKSLYGTVSLSWSVSKKVVTYEIIIPGNTTATIILDQCTQVIDTDGLPVNKVEDIWQLEAGSGTYKIQYCMK